MGLGGFIKKAIGAAAPVIGAATGNPHLALLGEGIGAAATTADKQDFAANSAATANAFTEKQLKNRHQWEVDDLRAAGLNPILSAMKGAPSIGGSAMASVSGGMAEDAAAISNAHSNRANSASAALMARLQEQKLKSEIELLQSNAAAAKASGVKYMADANQTGNIANITKNFSNLATGFHDFTSNTAKTFKNNLDDLMTFPSEFRKQWNQKYGKPKK